MVDDEDYKELNKYNWSCTSKNRYTSYAVRVNKSKKAILMHRVIMNTPSHLHIDHINGNGLDNRKENLRLCTNTENQGNRKLNENNSSGVKGVYWHKSSKKWVAQIWANYKCKNLGYFTDINDAKSAYTKAAKQHFGEFYSDR